MTKQYDNYADLITFTRASTGTYLDSDGLLKTATTNTPRIEYDADGNRLGLLIEEARTNNMIRSEEFDNAQWTKLGVGNGLAAVVTANAGLSPDGATTADRIVFDAVDSAGQSQVNNLSGTQLTGICTFSVWLKAETGTPTVYLRIDWSGGAAIANAVLTNEWQRYSVTMPSSESSVTTVNRGTIGTRPLLGTSTSATVFAWGAQLEAGSFPTSYIPTAGATATRAADVASIPTSAFGYNADKGTVVAEMNHPLANRAGGRKYIWNVNDSGNDRLSLRASDAVNNIVEPRAVVGNGVSNADIPCPVTTAAKYTVALSYDNTGATMAVNGTLASETGAYAGSQQTTLALAQSGGGSSQPNGHLKSIQYYPRRLTNAQLQRLTT